MKILKILLVIVGAVGVTALGIDAADTLRGSDGTLLSQIISADPARECPVGMVRIVGLSEKRCIDAYEVSTGDACPVKTPENMMHSKENVDHASCAPVSVEDRIPWRNLTRSQAETACARAGKRLPTSEEWYRAALGTPDTEAEECNIDSNTLSEAGEKSACVSASGAYDMVGNVWEWVTGDVEGMTYGDVTLPESGFVASIDSLGTPRTATSTESSEFNADYVWTYDAEELHGILRGGFYNSGPDAGVYAFHAGSLPTTPGTAIGFRCVQ